MKTRTAALIAALAVGTSAFYLIAQQTDQAPPRERPAPPERPRGDRPPGGPPGGPGRRFEGGWLDEQQRDLVREAIQKDREEFRKLEERMHTAQRELMQAILVEKQDEQLVRQKAQAVAKIQAEQTVLRAKAFAVVVPTLKPEQREQIENAPFPLGMLMGGFGGFGGGMRPPMDRPGEPGRDRPDRPPGERPRP